MDFNTFLYENFNHQEIHRKNIENFFIENSELANHFVSSKTKINLGNYGNICYELLPKTKNLLLTNQIVSNFAKNINFIPQIFLGFSYIIDDELDGTKSVNTIIELIFTFTDIKNNIVKELGKISYKWNERLKCFLKNNIQIQPNLENIIKGFEESIKFFN